MDRFPSACLTAAALLVWTSAQAQPAAHPLNFFEGVTDSQGTMKVILNRPYRTHSTGIGRIAGDGSLLLVQRVEDEGKVPHERRWLIRQAGPGHYAGSMSEATSPVVIDEIDGRFRFRFSMKGHLSVEEWLAPLVGGATARTTITVRKFGMTVATSEAMIRKVTAS
jgi:hypothetical protein